MICAVFWGADMKGATFRDVDLTGTRISHAWLVDVEVDALVDRLVVNGVDVTAYVNERDPWYPLRTMLTPPDVAGVLATWEALEQVWAPVIARVEAMAESTQRRSVDGEWSCAVRDGVYTVLEEEFWHHRYAVRDLAIIERGGAR